MLFTLVVALSFLLFILFRIGESHGAQRKTRETKQTTEEDNNEKKSANVVVLRVQTECAMRFVRGGE